MRVEGHTERAIFVIDSEGIIRYIDIHEFNQQPDNEVLFAEIEKLAPGKSGPVAMPAPIEEEVPFGGVVMYCTSWCPDCRRARTWLNAHQIPFREVDITRNRTAAAQVRGWARGHETTPTFNIDGTIIVHFNESRLKEVLNIS